MKPLLFWYVEKTADGAAILKVVTAPLCGDFVYKQGAPTWFYHKPYIQSLKHVFISNFNLIIDT